MEEDQAFCSWFVGWVVDHIIFFSDRFFDVNILEKKYISIRCIYHICMCFIVDIAIPTFHFTYVSERMRGLIDNTMWFSNGFKVDSTFVRRRCQRS